jgi:four helix bundle protein
MKENIIKSKSFAFALNIVKLYQYLTDSKKEYILSKQLLRSGTSIGAMVREAEHAESKADFIHKLSIGLKEANETEYWLDLLHCSGYVGNDDFKNVKEKVTEQLKLLTSIINSSKKIINY